MQEHARAGLQAKLDRAEEHIRQLQHESDAFFAEGPQHTADGLDHQAAEALRALHRDRAIPLRFAILAGEAIQQMRSCLDHLVWALVLRDHGEPSDRSQFPILDQPPTDKDQRRRYDQKIAGIEREEVREIIGSFQPHISGRSPGLHPLSVLRDLSNIDKHRHLVLHNVVCVQRSHQVDLTPYFPSIDDDGTDGTVILCDGEPVRMREEKGWLTAGIAFADWGGRGPGMEVVGGLKVLRNHVRCALEELAPFL